MNNKIAGSSIAVSILLSVSGLAQEPAAQGAGVFGAYESSKKWVRPSDPLVLKGLQEWQDMKVGVLIHWGIYSQWGITESWSQVSTRHIWNKRPEQFSDLSDAEYKEVYESWMETFDPVDFNPQRWAKAISTNLIQYAIFTTKHHDGFCMWDTQTSDFKITSERCPFHDDPHADIVGALYDELRAHGIATGLYFSKSDWHHTDYWIPENGPGSGQGPNYDPRQKPARWQRFQDYTWRQVEELVSGYGPQKVLWLDGGSVRPPNAGIDMDGLAKMARSYQPGLIVVDRTVHGPNENYVTPEGHIPSQYLPYPWETCMPMGTAWVWKPDDNGLVAFPESIQKQPPSRHAWALRIPKRNTGKR